MAKKWKSPGIQNTDKSKRDKKRRPMKQTDAQLLWINKAENLFPIGQPLVAQLVSVAFFGYFQRFFLCIADNKGLFTVSRKSQTLMRWVNRVHVGELTEGHVYTPMPARACYMLACYSTVLQHCKFKWMYLQDMLTHKIQRGIENRVRRRGAGKLSKSQQIPLQINVINVCFFFQ